MPDEKKKKLRGRWDEIIITDTEAIKKRTKTRKDRKTGTSLETTIEKIIPKARGEKIVKRLEKKEVKKEKQKDKKLKPGPRVKTNLGGYIKSRLTGKLQKKRYIIPTRRKKIK